MMKTLVIAIVPLLPIFSMQLVHANDEAAEKCAEHQGNLVTGQVMQKPMIYTAKRKFHGLSLSRTHINLKDDNGRGVYDVVLDNVFAMDFAGNNEQEPPSIMAIKVGDHLEVCGRISPASNALIDHVHINCGQLPSPEAPDGWLKKKMQMVLGVGIL